MKRNLNMFAIVAFLLALLIFLADMSSLQAGGVNAQSIPEVVEVETETKEEIKFSNRAPLRLNTWYQMPIVEVKEEENGTPPIIEEPAAAAIEVVSEPVYTGEYPAAEYIWQYMKDLGWNDYVCAGVMGNLMAEVGGQTLNIQYNLYSSDGGYYGMCQWSKKYHSGIYGINDLNTQCDYLRDTIKYEIDTFGYKYQTNFNLEAFLNLTDAQQAALAFAKTYERCASGSYAVRQRNAITAYNYFVK
jgi:hypothetical protein